MREAAEEMQAAPPVSEANRRRAFRRKLPFGRAGVLTVGDRAHIVGIADVSVSGAFLSTRAPVSVGDIHVLKLVLMPECVELGVQAEVVRVAQLEDESQDHPRGVAVRFVELDEAGRRSLEVFVSREPSSTPA